MDVRCVNCTEEFELSDESCAHEFCCPHCSSRMTIQDDGTVSLQPGALPSPIPETLDHVTSPSEHAVEPLAGLPSFPDYEVIEMVGRGGMGVVLKARQRVLGRLVAIKLPLSGQLADGEERERFLREARSAARLRHPNICPIHQIGEIDGRPFLVMGFIQGSTLQRWAEERRPSARQSAEMVALLAEAVDYAHQHGVIHRDLKPGNVIVDDDLGQPVLMDFGLAKELGEQDSHLTQSGQIMGTPAYMAPEQAAGRQDVIGPAADVYSLGAILYRLLCGQPPFSGSVAEVLRKVQSDEPPALRTLAPKIHRDLETICLKAIHKLPGRRYSSAGELARDLKRFVAGEAILARREPWVRKVFRRIRRSPITTVAFAGLLLIGAVAGVTGFKFFVTSQRATLAQRFEAGLDASDWPDLHLRTMQDLAAELAGLSGTEPAPWDGRLCQRVGEVIDSILTQPRLAPQAASNVERLLAWLRDRDAQAARALQNAYDRRLRVWEPVFELVPPFDNLEQVLDASRMRREGDVLALVVDQDAQQFQPESGATLVVKADWAANVRLEVELDERWQSATSIGLLLDVQQTYEAEVFDVEFSPDGQRLYVASGQSKGPAAIRSWDLADERDVWTYRFPKLGRCRMSLAPDGTTLAVGHHLEEEIRVLEASTGREIANYPLSSGYVGALAYAPDGATIAIGAGAWQKRGSFEVRDASSGELQFRSDEQPDLVTAVVFSPNGRLLAIAGERWGQIWDLTTKTRTATIDLPGHRPWLQFSADGGVLFIRSKNQLICWDLKANREHVDVHPKLRYVGCAAFAVTADDCELIAANGDGVLSSWRMPSLRQYVDFDECFQAISLLRCSPGGKRLAAGTLEGSVYVWDRSSRERTHLLGGEGYAFEISANQHNADSEVPAPRHLNRNRVLGKHRTLTIRRQQTTLQIGTLSVAKLAGRPLRLTAVREGNRLTLRVNEAQSLAFEELFATRVTGGAGLGLRLPPNVGLHRLAAFRQPLSRQVSLLERGDELFSDAKCAQALEVYRAQTFSAHQEGWQRESTYKIGLCLWKLDRHDEAITELERLAENQEDRWALLSTFQLWLICLQRAQLDEAEAIFESLLARHPFEKLAALIPAELRQQILVQYVRLGRGFNIYRSEPELLVSAMERATAVAEYLNARPTSFNSVEKNLVRAYCLAGREDRALQVLQARVQSFDPAAPYGNPASVIREYAQVLCRQNQVEEAAKVLDRFLASDTYSSPELLLVERARTAAVAQSWSEAEAYIERLFREGRIGDFSNSYKDACLLRGFLCDRRGDKAAAQDAWRQGLRNTPVNAFFGQEFIAHLLLVSLTGELDDRQAQELLQNALSEISSGSMLEVLKGSLGTTVFRPALLRAMFLNAWRRPRGQEFLAKFVLRQLSFVDQVRLPPQLIAAEALRQGALPKELSAEQESVLWQTVTSAYNQFVKTQSLTERHFLQFALTWKGTTNFLGWGGVAPSLKPPFRAQLAYVFGHRYRDRLKRSQEAIAFFRTAAQDSPPGSTLQRLAQKELDRQSAE